MKRARTFTVEFKAQVVLEEVTGTKSAAEVYRQHTITSSVFLSMEDRIFGPCSSCLPT